LDLGKNKTLHPQTHPISYDCDDLVLQAILSKYFSNALLKLHSILQ